MAATPRLAGLPLGRWAFAVRIWLAIHLALGAAFWIQLDGASSAGVTVGILALQTRGQILEKAAYRLLGTAVGGAVAILIVGLFAQTREPYVLTYSAWLGVCVFAAGFLDGSRAYAAVLSGYTVSIVAVFQIDDPGRVFDQIVNRCGAIAIGIASVTLVVDLLRGREIGPDLLDRIERGRHEVRAFTDGLLRRGPDADTDARTAAMMRTASDQHPLLNALPIETVSGTARAGAVRATLAALVGEVRAARALSAQARMRPDPGNPHLRALIVARLEGEVEAGREASATAFAAARRGQPVACPPRMPIHRSRENAALNGLRAFVASVVSGYLFVLAGWPAASVAWGLVGVVMCLASNAPDPDAMTKAALVALPAAVVMGGITEFLILGGVDQFPLLMIGMAPALFTGLLMMSSPKPAYAGIGMLTTVFTLVVVSPSNPQSYDPQSYVVLSILVSTAAILVFVLVRVLFPTGDAHRRRWTSDALRRDLRLALRGAGLGRPEAEARLLDASRIGTLDGLKGTGPLDVTVALRMADLATAARRISRALDRFEARHGDTGMAGRIREARAALAATDAVDLRRIAGVIADSSETDVATLAADLAWAADLIDAPDGAGSGAAA